MVLVLGKYIYTVELKVLQYLGMCLRVYYVVKSCWVPAAVGCIEASGTLTRCTLLLFMCALKAAAQMNVERCIIQELNLYEFQLGHNGLDRTCKATKYICCTKSEGAVYYR